MFSFYLIDFKVLIFLYLNFVCFFFMFYTWDKWESNHVTRLSYRWLTYTFVWVPFFVLSFNSGSLYLFYGINTNVFSFCSWDTFNTGVYALNRHGPTVLEELKLCKFGSVSVWSALSAIDSGFNNFFSTLFHALYLGIGIYNVLKHRWTFLREANDAFTRRATLNSLIMFLTIITCMPYVFMYVLEWRYTACFDLTFFFAAPYALFLGRYTQIFVICSLCGFIPQISGFSFFFDFCNFFNFPFTLSWGAKFNRVFKLFYWSYYIYIWYLITPKKERDVFYISIPSLLILYFGREIFEIF